MDSSSSALIHKFQEWVDGVAGIKRPKEIKIIAHPDPNFGFVGVLDLPSQQTGSFSHNGVEPSAKRSVCSHFIILIGG